MVTAYILITVKSGTERDVLAELKKLEEVKDVAIVYGEYDLIIKVTVPEVGDLNDFLLSKLRPIKNIEKTATLIVAA